MDQIKYEQLIKDFRLNAKDTGSSAVQVINLTKRILELTDHLKVQKKDITAKRSLLKMVATRKRFLRYYKTQDLTAHGKLLTALTLKDN
ncbi:30S ribosomal protein S15 [Spiroplasma sp. AdecLV25b]|uniref:30S ribosomal protein S15 n=1 Tax=Spiroplasma sp. AdecLV25b TaxID=3027162 RepID=UPI0027E1085F|nr:30S ribosomal protein S15 [Spiroplasma sp. AdecLV25b]